MSPVTLKDIAARAGVSKMTVSLALRGHPHSAAATRDRIRQLADEMGYRPNPLLAASMAYLRAGRRSSYAGTIAFLGHGESPDRNGTNTQSRRIYAGAERRTEALGYRIEWFSLASDQLDGARLTEILKARGIVGVVVAADGLLAPNRRLEWSQFALAAVGRTDVGSELHRTAGDYYRAVREACQRCRERGYRRIGFATTREHDTAHQSLHRSALLGCQADWRKADHVPVLVADEWTPRRFLAWVRQHRPEVVLCSSDPPVRWLQDAGYRIPQDIGFIRPHVSTRELGIAGFLFDEAELGAAAIDLVVEQLNHNERGLPRLVKRVLLPGRWFEGKSLRSA